MTMWQPVRWLGACMSAFVLVTSASDAQTTRVPGLDVEHVALDLRFDLEARKAEGVARLRLHLTEPGARVALDGAGLRIGGVEVDGRTARFEYSGGAEDGALVVDLGRRYAANRSLELTVHYETSVINDSDPANIWGSAGLGLRFHSPSPTDLRRRPQIWSSSAPNGARYWFPGHDRLDDLRTFELRATVAHPLTVVSNGDLVSTRDDGNGQTTFHWRLDRPQQNYRTAVAIGVFENVSERAHGVTLNNFGYPDEREGVVASIERLPDMVDFMERTIGVEFPYPSYTQVFVQELPGAAANAGLTVQTENFIDSVEVHRDFLYLWDDLEAEPLAEQWFGNAVAIADWRDGWLTRAIPRYLATRYNEARNSEAEVLLSFYHTPGDLQAVLGDWDSGVRVPVVPDAVEDPAAFLSSNAPYLRGAMVLRLLEMEIGRERLTRALGDFARRGRASFVSTQTFEQAVTRAAGRDMTWFFNQWLRRADFPVITVTKRYDAARRTLTLEVCQRAPDGAAEGAAFRPFAGLVGVEIDGAVRQIRLTRADESFDFEVDHAPRVVNFDYKSRWLARIEFNRSPEELLALARESTDLLARRNAMIELGTLAAREETAAGVRAQVLDLLGATLESNEYWRLKIVAITQLRAVMARGGSAPRGGLDAPSEARLVRVIERAPRDEAWVVTSALSWLGETHDSQYARLYRAHLRDPSDRVINAAAVALGKSGAPGVFEDLVALESHPSWKNQSRISMLDGLAELGDPRGVAIALSALRDAGGARWTLLTPVWDYRLTAARTLQRLGGQAQGYDYASTMLRQAAESGHVNDTVYNANLLVALGDPRGAAAIGEASSAFEGRPGMAEALSALAAQLNPPS